MRRTGAPASVPSALRPCHGRRSEAEALAQFAGANALGRLVLPEEVAERVTWLIRDDAASLNGQTLALE